MSLIDQTVPCWVSPVFILNSLLCEVTLKSSSVLPLSLAHPFLSFT